MKIHFPVGKNYLGSKIIKALSSISEYKTKVIVKEDTFDRKLGIIPKKADIRLVSISPDYQHTPNTEYHICIKIPNIVFGLRYGVINWQINFLYSIDDPISLGVLTKYNNREKTDLVKKMEVVIRQFLKNLNINEV